MTRRLSHIETLEAEAIHILRETVPTAARPVLLYSVGKDSSVLLHLAQKAFYPAPPPFPMLHIDTGWKFREMIAFRDRRAAETGIELIVHTNPDDQGLTPFDDADGRYTHAMKTVALRQALDAGGFDMAIGGARRDEEASRAKERVFSLRAPGHVWDPKRQRPELWRVFNTRLSPGETMRVFPLSNWTELDVWTYIREQSIPVVPLYFSRARPVVERDGRLIMADDNRLKLRPGERIEQRQVRFRTLGCWPLTAAEASVADDLDAVIAEIESAPRSERSGRLIDQAEAGAIEKKKREGYF